MDARRRLRQWGLEPDKGLGQNFLVDPDVRARIVAAAELTSNDVVLEIGAGTGALTRQLAQEAGHVVAVELDRELIPLLTSELSDLDNVAIVQGDILKLEPRRLIEAAVKRRPGSGYGYKVVANLPYYVTSAVLRHLLEASCKPKRIVVTVQREVAERIVADPGQMSLLAVSVQFYGQPELLFRIRPGSFYPSPQVESAVVRIDLLDAPPLPPEETERFFRVVRAGFSQRRKQLHNSLSNGLGPQATKYQMAEKLEEVGIDHRRRAQTLTVAEWIELTRALGDLGVV